MEGIDNKQLLIMGVGNVLMGDEGVGIHAIKALEEEKLPAHVALLDGGTGGFHLLSYLKDFDHVIMLDATMDGRPEGYVKVIHPKFSSDFPRALSAHDIGLKDLVESAILLGHLPKIDLITISIHDIQNMTMELSPHVAAAIPEVVKETKGLVAAVEVESK